MVIRRGQKSISGISLIETCIFLVVAGIFIMGAMQLYKIWRAEDVVAVAQNTIIDTQTALDNFYAAHGRYPCPARRNLSPSDPNWGKEMPSCNNGNAVTNPLTAEAIGYSVAAPRTNLVNPALADPVIGVPDVQSGMPAGNPGNLVATGALPVNAGHLAPPIPNDVPDQRGLHGAIDIVRDSGGLNNVGTNKGRADQGTAPGCGGPGQDRCVTGGGALYVIAAAPPDGARARTLEGKPKKTCGGVPDPCTNSGDVTNALDGGTFVNTLVTGGRTGRVNAFGMRTGSCMSPSGVLENGICGLAANNAGSAPVGGPFALGVSPWRPDLPEDSRCALLTTMTLPPGVTLSPQSRIICNSGNPPRDQTVANNWLNGAQLVGSKWTWNCQGQCTGINTTADCKRDACTPKDTKCGLADLQGKPLPAQPSGSDACGWVGMKNGDSSANGGLTWTWKCRGDCFGKWEGHGGITTGPGLPAQPPAAGAHATCTPSQHIPNPDCSVPWCGKVNAICGTANGGKGTRAAPPVGKLCNTNAGDGQPSSDGYVAVAALNPAKTAWEWQCKPTCRSGKDVNGNTVDCHTNAGACLGNSISCAKDCTAKVASCPAIGGAIYTAGQIPDCPSGFVKDAKPVLSDGVFRWKCVPSDGHICSGDTNAKCSVNQAVDGSCGRANGSTSGSAPSANLCSAGPASGVSRSGSDWVWTCGGKWGGTTASCSARGVDPVDTDSCPVIISIYQAYWALGYRGPGTGPSSGRGLPLVYNNSETPGGDSWVRGHCTSADHTIDRDCSHGDVCCRVGYSGQSYWCDKMAICRGRYSYMTGCHL